MHWPVSLTVSKKTIIMRIPKIAEMKRHRPSRSLLCFSTKRRSGGRAFWHLVWCINAKWKIHPLRWSQCIFLSMGLGALGWFGEIFFGDAQVRLSSYSFSHAPTMHNATSVTWEMHFCHNLGICEIILQRVQFLSCMSCRYMMAQIYQNVISLPFPCTAVDPDW